MKWTNDQQAAIEAHGASVAVSAAAGSGKTAVLVERLVRLLSDEENGVRAETLAVMTFTNDAAAEMRDRLTRALDEKMLSEPQNGWLRRQQTMLQCASISTIHSFCYRIMREQFAQLNIAADFRTLEENEDRILRAQAASAVLEEYHQRAQAEPEIKKALSLLTEAFCPGNDDALEDILLTLLDFTDSRPFGEGLLAESAEACENGRMLGSAFAELSQTLSAAQSLLTQAKALMLPHGTKKQTDSLTDECIALDRRVQACAAKDHKQLAELLGSSIWTKSLRLTCKADPAAAAQAKALRGHAKELCDRLAAEWQVPLALADADLKRHAAILRAADGMVARLRAELSDRKRERNAVSFSDAMHMTLSLLAKPETDGNGARVIRRTELAEQLSAQFSCIMVDEFQDADDHQDLIFRLLSKGGDALHYGSDLFFVGDAKQCIYRFRNANPANFGKAMSASTPYAGDPALTQNTLICLNQNFRSAPEIIDTVNFIFGQLMTPAVGEIAYDSTQALHRGAAYPAAKRPVELLLLPTSGENTPDEPTAVAMRIQQHLKAGTPVTVHEQTRPCKPSDFLILLRTKTHMQDYAEALAKLGIPVAVTEQSGYLAAPEIRLLLDMLRAVDDPLLDAPLAAMMLSPMFGFSLDDLAALRIADRKRRLFPAMEHLRRLWIREHEPEKVTKKAKSAEKPEDQPEEKFPADFDPALLQRVFGLLDFLGEMRLFAATETPEQLIRRLMAQTDFLGLTRLAADAAIPGSGAQKKANLRALAQHAKHCEENRGGGLSGFLRYLDALTVRGADLPGGSVPNGTDNAVSIKTIHKSKGLEAPFVILANSDHRFSREDDKKTCQFHAETGIGFKLNDPAVFASGSSLPAQTVISRARREAVSEELRLLYVALTRPREYLILPLCFSKSYSAKAGDFAAEQQYQHGQTDLLTQRAGSMRDWLIMALIRNPACEALRKAMELSCETDGAQPFLDVVFPPVTMPEKQEAAEKQAAAPNPALVRRLTEQCSMRYDSPLAALTAKYGVSELAKAEDFSAPLRRPLFVREASGLSGAERGTAVHTFLQYADFAAAAEDLPAEVEALRKIGRLTQKQAGAIIGSRKKVETFFSSDLCRRIRAAKHVDRERKFTVRLSDLPLNGELAGIGAQYADTDGMLIGIMDLVFEEQNGDIILVDYKTDSVPDGEALLERYTEQLRLYAAALFLLTGRPVREWYLYSIHLQRAIRGDI